ncbi:MAG TPA: LUD domain-containing protein [Planctomycetaceae bacterium]|nr:LUD domain-containing protein [Planctomycetaceae bacterium]
MSRETILRSIRQHLPQSSPLPELTGPWIKYADPIAQFTSVLEMIGGSCVRVASVDAIPERLGQLPQFASAQRTLSLVPGIAANVSMDAIDDPHQLEDVDFAILPGEFAVAENAAVWVTDRGVKHRVIYFLCQHLALVVPASQVVNNLSEAYERIDFREPHFGAFIAGPSKTADIEQSLVIGAHGPRSMTVFLVDQ